MPPIPIHKDAPIQPTGAQADGTTPQTANPPPTRTVPASIPATTTATSNEPPAPQPGARPPPPTASSAQASTSASGPAAPQPGHGYTAVHTTTETRLGGPPHFSVPPPSDSQLAGRSTTTSTTASKPGPTTLNLGPVASAHQAEHTGGAVPGDDGERRSLEHPPGYVQAPDNAPYSAGGGLGSFHGSDRGGAAGDEGVGSAAWNMLAKAGEALRKGEEAAWRAVRNK